MSNKNNDIPIWRRGDAYPDDWPEWLRAADIEWCRVEIEEGGKVAWHDGIWCDGTWHNGDWRAGTWRYGEWHDGFWYDGVWCDGIWYDGEWHGGEWRTGIWRNGHWRGGEWRDGAWFDGRWYGGDWRDGVWCNGVWHRGDWHGGRWLDGGRYDGGWHDGEAWRTDGPPDDSVQPENHMSKTETDVIEYPHHDMDLRDRLAAHVIQGLLANPNVPIQADGTSCTIEEVADLAWRIADHMLKARGGSNAD